MAAKAARTGARKADEQAGDGPCLVVGYDGSAGARAAVAWAARVLPQDGRLVLVHACRPLHVPPGVVGSPAERTRYGRALIDELVLDGETALLERLLTADVADEDPVTALNSAAQRFAADGIVVGARGHSRLRKLVGTVTGDLLARSGVPVIAVPASA
jgi:nucleotide-binding universal stress UspA family protein